MRNKENKMKILAKAVFSITILLMILMTAWMIHLNWGFNDATGRYDTDEQQQHSLDHYNGRSHDWWE